jgi:hypothetical protein
MVCGVVGACSVRGELSWIRELSAEFFEHFCAEFIHGVEDHAV